MLWKPKTTSGFTGYFAQKQTLQNTIQRRREAKTKSNGGKGLLGPSLPNGHHDYGIGASCKLLPAESSNRVTARLNLQSWLSRCIHGTPYPGLETEPKSLPAEDLGTTATYCVEKGMGETLATGDDLDEKMPVCNIDCRGKVYLLSKILGTEQSLSSV